MSSNPNVPPFTGYVETTTNALRLIHAARHGVVPRITRRLNDAERRSMIRSGSVFIFGVEESGIKRWTDGLLWSPSRIVGNFLVYREINERSSSRNSHHRKPYPTEESPARAMVRKSSPDQMPMGYRAQANDQGTFKSGGLIKKTITVTIDGADLHLISYYTSEDIRSGRLKRPSSRPDIMALPMPVDIFRLTNFRVPPKTEIGPNGKQRFVETEEADLGIDCKIEDPCYNIPSSPVWSGQGSPVSVEENLNGYASAPMYSFNGGQSSTGPSGYGRNSQRWSPGMGGDLTAPLSQTNMGWSPSTSTLTSGHTMGRRRESNFQSDGWPSIHSQSTGRGLNWPHDAPLPTTSPNVFQGRSRVLRTPHTYDGGAAPLSGRREQDGPPSNNFPLRPTPHPNTTREDALQRLHWHPSSRDSDPSRAHRRGGSTASHSTYSGPFNSQGGYHPSPPTYTSSWTSTDANIMTTPTLHSIPSNQTQLSYDGSYTSDVNSSVPSSDQYAKVEYSES